MINLVSRVGQGEGLFLKRSVPAGTVRDSRLVHFTFLRSSIPLYILLLHVVSFLKPFYIFPKVIAYYNGVHLEGQEPEGVSWEERSYRSRHF